jgi:hypothetical protein
MAAAKSPIALDAFDGFKAAVFGVGEFLCV